MKHLLCISFLSGLLIIQAWHLHRETRDRIASEAQRDEAVELAQKAQDTALYWYDVHAKTVAHYNRK